MNINLMAIMPEILILTVGMLVLILDPFWKDENRRIGFLRHDVSERIMPREVTYQALHSWDRHGWQEFERNGSPVAVRNTHAFSMLLGYSLTINLRPELEVVRDGASVIAVVFDRFKGQVSEC